MQRVGHKCKHSSIQEKKCMIFYKNKCKINTSSSTYWTPKVWSTSIKSVFTFVYVADVERGDREWKKDPSWAKDAISTSSAYSSLNNATTKESLGSLSN